MSATGALRRDRLPRTAPSQSGCTLMAVRESCREHSDRDASVVQLLEVTDTGEQKANEPCGMWGLIGPGSTTI